MCTPVEGTLIGLQVASGAMGAEAAQEGAAAKARYYDFLATQNEVQAKRVKERGEQTATSIAEAAALDQDRLERGVRRVEGTQRAATGASGTSGSVTAEDIVRDTARTHDLDVEALRYDADSKIWAARTGASDQATALRDQANQFRYAGANAKYAGDLAVGTSLLGTATSVADTWYRFGQTGAGRTPGTVKTPAAGGGGGAAPDFGNN